MSRSEKEDKPTLAEILFFAVFIFTWVMLAYIPIAFYDTGEIKIGGLEVSAGLFIMLYISYLGSLFSILAFAICGILEEDRCDSNGREN